MLIMVTRIQTWLALLLFIENWYKGIFFSCLRNPLEFWCQIFQLFSFSWYFQSFCFSRDLKWNSEIFIRLFFSDLLLDIIEGSSLIWVYPYIEIIISKKIFRNILKNLLNLVSYTTTKWGAWSVMVTVVGKGYGELRSNLNEAVALGLISFGERYASNYFPSSYG